MTRHCSPVLRVFSAAATALLLLAILGPFFQVLQGALFPQGTGFALEAVYKVFLATPEYLLVFWRTIALCALMVGARWCSPSWRVWDLPSTISPGRSCGSFCCWW